VVSVIRLPGFAEEPIALAVTDDGSTLILDLSRVGEVRVAGTFRGPIGELAASGDWAIGTAPYRVTAFRITRA